MAEAVGAADPHCKYMKNYVVSFVILTGGGFEAQRLSSALSITTK